MSDRSPPLLSRLALSARPHRAGASRRPTGLLAGIADFLARRRQQRRLRMMEDYLLDDIGLSRAEAEQEAGRIHWEAPAHWRR
ncbi:DUF1127 domain-containing protein [Pseudogemmobacter bohemicus]|uniref:DUF1127 domain-containing protein n=1 Tax=Pseudogemmobacter bohemicus TaxID=2250708 RepID=UPI00130068C8|nr:DUF1127 domain-containing protein [Pseudogemmobacter bohemicus]